MAGSKGGRGSKSLRIALRRLRGAESLSLEQMLVVSGVGPLQKRVGGVGRADCPPSPHISDPNRPCHQHRSVSNPHSERD